MPGMELHSQTSTMEPLNVEMDKLFHPTLYNGCDYVSMLGSKLIHVSKGGNWCDLSLVICLFRLIPHIALP